jgi:hypothetical protein
MGRMLLGIVVALSGCAPTVVTQFNGHSIQIQSSSPRMTPYVISVAQRICGTQGLQAEYASTISPASTFIYYHLFLCLTQARPNAGLPSGIRTTPNYLETTSTL